MTAVSSQTTQSELQSELLSDNLSFPYQLRQAPRPLVGLVHIPTLTIKAKTP